MTDLEAGEAAHARRRRLMAIGAVLALAAGASALAAPLAHQVAPRASTVVASLSAQPAVPAPQRLVWRGVDVDGDGSPDFANPTGKDTRKSDAYGEGEFGASRDGGVRRHEGVDFMADAGQPVRAPLSGFVTKIGFAYSGDDTLKFVEITNPALGYAARVFYVDPAVAVGQAVRIGEVIGDHHTLEDRYPGGMTDHVHLEILAHGGQRIDATQLFTARYEPVPPARG
jgi:murein DD-endopeptidase MepM/ murein hydrolase activator NlpD